MYENIPQELKEYSNWCLYRLVKRDGKNTKIPINGLTGDFAKSNDKNTWQDFDTCVSNINKFNANGVGFFFEPPFFGVDIDHIEEDLELFKAGVSDNIVSEFYDSLKTYGEISQSGKGVHFICKGELPKGSRRKGNIEMYQTGRFFVMTGNTISTLIDYVNDCSDEIVPLFDKYLKSKKTGVNLNENDEVDEILKIAFKNQKFADLFQNKHEFNSQSEADMSFCNYLAYYCAKNPITMDKIFRKSLLYRPKWDEKRGEYTYGERTINKAISDCAKIYSEDGYSLNFDFEKVCSFDDTGNAERFYRKFGNIVKYNFDNKSFMIYNGSYWSDDTYNTVKTLCESVIDNMKAEFKYLTEEDEEKALLKHIKYTRNNKGKENMLKEVQHKIAITNADFDKDNFLLNVQNGVIDLKNFVFKMHDKNYLFSKMASPEFDLESTCPKWIKFLREIFLNDEKLIEFIQKAIGYSLTGSTVEQGLFILYGNGLNGKSVFLEVISALFGSYALNIQPSSLMVKNQTGNANNDIARLKGARFVTTTEPNDGMRFDEGLIKQLTGGDKVTARFLYKNEFEFLPTFKIWMATNHKPIIRGNDRGIWRRLNIIPFNAEIKNINKNLKNELIEELPGILNWALKGLKAYVREGLEKPESIKQSIEEYKDEMDIIGQFIKENVIVHDGHKVKASVVYQAYKQWATENGHYVFSGTKFGIEFTKRFKKTRHGSGAFFVGITLVNL